jgi:ActR/RegA family two-component response regulator
LDCCSHRPQAEWSDGDGTAALRRASTRLRVDALVADFVWTLIAERMRRDELPDGISPTTAALVDPPGRRSTAAESGELVDALLTGAVTGPLAIWEVSNRLRLPRRGPYVVAAVRADTDGPSDDLELRVRSAGFAAAWRTTRDDHTGLVGLTRRAGDDRRLVAALRTRSASLSIGVSSAFACLDQAAESAVLARAAALAAARRGQVVCAFDDDPLAVAVVAAAGVGKRAARTVLAGLDGTADDVREGLLETFQVWVECNGSTSDAARRLYLHRNTVRSRLKRLEDRTGRSLSSPRAVAELCMAVAARGRPSIRAAFS